MLQWTPSNKDTIGTLLSVPNRGVSLFILGLFCTCFYVSGTEDGVLYSGTSCSTVLYDPFFLPHRVYVLLPRALLTVYYSVYSQKQSDSDS